MLQNKKRIGFILVGIIYASLLVAFLITAIVGLDKSLAWIINQTDDSTTTFHISLWQIIIKQTEGSPSTETILNPAAIVSLVFLGVAFISFVIALIVNKWQFNLIYVILTLVLATGVVIAIMSSKPKISYTDETNFGYLFVDDNDPAHLNFSIAGYVMIGVTAAVGVSYVLLGCLWVKAVLLNKSVKK
ncbi:MAG: hypothetical protein LBD63_00965 [Mycoplasmataceae bacterium]|jgi:hypothetical protein|nr:hypothetical protein [Mycoplasmataceae bacterium]